MAKTVLDKTSPELTTALDLLARGLWPVAIYPAGILIPTKDGPKTSTGKEPIGREWGKVRPTANSLRATYAANPGAGVGLRLGPESDVIDVENDGGEEGDATFIAMMGGEDVPTIGWGANRGGHKLFRYDSRLVKYGKTIIHTGGLEIRIGTIDLAKPRQMQSVCPPSLKTDGKPREWNGVNAIATLPEAFFRYLDHEFPPAPKPTSLPKAATKRKSKSGEATAEDRAIAYLSTIEPAVSGQNGSKPTFRAAIAIGPGFDLPPETAIRLLMDCYSPRCVPPWSEGEIRHKVSDAYQATTDRGWLLNAERNNGHTNGVTKTSRPKREEAPPPPPENPPEGDREPEPFGPHESPDDPHRLARLYVEMRHGHKETPRIRYWNEEWHHWHHAAWHPVSDKEINAQLVGVIKLEFDRLAQESGATVKAVTTKVVGNAAQALRHVCLLTTEDCGRQPAWIGPKDMGEDLPDPTEILPAGNSLIHLPTFTAGRDAAMKITPRFFSANTLGYDFTPKAGDPKGWLEFLVELWPEDQQAIDSLQEWFGYLLTPDTSLQKILMIIGPKRSGKGTIARVLRAVVGESNVAAPTLSGLATNFGLAPLIGKTLALIADARLSGRSDSQVIVERLLSISGEDAQTIDRKHLSSWTGSLPTRFALISNELPRLGDSSGAIPARMIVLRLTKSFYGDEDPALTGRLLAERPAILLWAIKGWSRLHERGRLLQPESGQELVDDLTDLASPIGTFVDERCRIGPDETAPIKELYEGWTTFCKDKGKDKPGDEQGFGRNLRAVMPHLKVKRTGSDGARVREYQGISLLTQYKF